MPHLSFPAPFRHDHPPVQNVNEVMDQRATLGQRTADAVARTMGSWPFIIVQTLLLTGWVILNVLAAINHWDPYPFILLNLFLSLQAAYAAPVIMMSQNRQAARDRLEAHNDFLVDTRTETEVHAVLEHLQAQNHALQVLATRIEEVARAVGLPAANGGEPAK